MSGTRDCELVGRWRITDADLWDRDYLDMAEPAYVQIGRDGWGSWLSVALPPPANWNIRAPLSSSAWSGFDEGHEISGDGSGELQDDGTIEIELSFDNGDYAILIGRSE
jgi:hypothetical protein